MGSPPFDRVLHLGLSGSDVAHLHEKLAEAGLIGSDAIGREVFNLDTQKAVLALQRKHHLPETGIVENVTASAAVAAPVRIPPLPIPFPRPVPLPNPLPNPLPLPLPIPLGAGTDKQFSITGIVRRVNGSPVPNLVIRAFDQDLRSQDLLGKATTNADGYYEIPYKASQFTRSEKKSADLRVSATDDRQGELVVSPIVFNAGDVETINLVVGGEVVRGRSEIELLLENISPVLGKLSPADLTENEKYQDITFMVGETGTDPEHLVLLSLAFRMSDRSQSLKPYPFYGLLRRGLSTTYEELVSLSLAIQFKALQEAVDMNIIPFQSYKEIDATVYQLRNLATLAAITPSGDTPPPLKLILSAPLPEIQFQQDFIKACAAAPSPEKLWDFLQDIPSLKPRIPQLQKTLQLSAFAGNHPPLVAELQRMNLETVADIVKIEPRRWGEIISQPTVGIPSDIPGKDDAEKRANFAQSITALVEDTYPTKYLAARISTDEQFPSSRRDFISFFGRNDEFDITSVRSSDYLRQLLDRDPNALSNLADPEAFQINLAKLQRVYSIAPRYNQAKAMLANGLDSSLVVARQSRTTFVKRFAQALGGGGEAELIHENASKVLAMTMNLVMNYGKKQAKWDLPVLLDTAVERVEGIPDWATLFGSVDSCSCEECMSVGSPAAYYVDVLHYLKDRLLVDKDSIVRDANDTIVDWKYLLNEDNEPKSVKEALFARRPDLEELELTCENTNIPLPYIELVNELLENLLSPLDPPIASLPDAEDIIDSLDGGEATDPLRTAFTPALSRYAQITVLEPGEAWAVDDAVCSYRVTLNPEKNLLDVTRSRRTRGTMQERAGVPQYFNASAYTKLQSSYHPCATLPFDLWLETVRMFLIHLGVPRWEVMMLFTPGAYLELIMNNDIAEERLGLSVKEVGLITGTLQVDPWTLWGFPAVDASPGHGIPDPVNSTAWIEQGRWDAILSSRIDVLLQQSGLTYLEVLQLLDTYFVNPLSEGERSLNIVAAPGVPDMTCELDKLLLDGISSEETYLQIMRFVRVWRALGWKFSELDRALRALGATTLDRISLRNLAHIKQISEQFGLPIDQVLSFWAEFDNHAYVDFEDDDSNMKKPRSYFQQLFGVEKLEDLADGGNSLLKAASSVSVVLSISLADFALLRLDSKVILQFPDPAHTDVMIPDDSLNLRNLARLQRHVAMVKFLGLNIRDYLSLLALMDADPFASPSATLLFSRRAKTALNSAFSVPELQYILGHQSTASSGIALPDDAISAQLTEIRDQIQKIQTEITLGAEPADPNSAPANIEEILLKKLGLLSWEPDLVATVMDMLNDRLSYLAPLDQLPLVNGTPLQIPPELQSKLAFDADSHLLHFSRAMTKAELTTLMNLEGVDAEFTIAVNDIYDQPIAFVKRNMATFVTPDYSKTLDSLPATVHIPTKYKTRFYYDPHAILLHVRGALTTTDRDYLAGLSTDSADPMNVTYRGAVEALYDQADHPPVVGDNAFLSESDADNLFKNPLEPSDRINRVLDHLLPYLRKKLSDDAITKSISQAFSMSGLITEALLNKWLHARSTTSPQAPVISVFRAPAFTESNKNVPILRAAFMDQFKIYELLHKVSLLVQRFQMTDRQLQWIFQLRTQTPADPTDQWLDLNILPLEAGSGNSGDLFIRWERLVALFNLRDQVGEVLLDTVFTKARLPDEQLEDLLDIISKDTGWPLEDLTYLFSAEGLGFTTIDSVRDEVALARIALAISALRQLGINASLARAIVRLNSASQDDIDALRRSVVEAAKSKYDQATWITILPKLQDPLREKQRDALVANLIPAPGWRKVNDLSARLLVDVEMSGCQITSRLKQAISSAQLFVQRCLMNLEQDILANQAVDGKWLDWDWMKAYRVWEANRKIFLYPENWIEPDFRDDQTPLFKELRDGLSQTDITMDTAEDGFRNYLSKLSEVARLSVVSMYQEEEFGLQGNRVLNILHVLARSRSDPPKYYYRQQSDAGVWTAWEYLEVECEGAHLVPIVWHRQLYLFWPTFAEKQELVPVRMPGTGESVNVGERYWEISLAWSVRQKGKWSPKNLSQDNLLCWIGRTGLTDPNNAPHGAKRLLTFKGFIDAKLDTLNIVSLRETWPGVNGVFQFDGINSSPKVTSLDYQTSSRLAEVVGPQNASVYFEGFVLPGTSTTQLALRTESKLVGSTNSEILGPSVYQKVLNTVPGYSQIINAHQDEHFFSQRAFFFQHTNQTFFVEPERYLFPPAVVRNPRYLDLGVIDRLKDRYFNIPKFVDRQLIRDISQTNPAVVRAINPSISLGAVLPRAIGNALQKFQSGPAKVVQPVIPRSLSPRSLTSVNFVPIKVVRDYIDLLTPITMKPVLNFVWKTEYKFTLFYHPNIDNLLRELHRTGIDGLMRRNLQLTTREVFSSLGPEPATVQVPYPAEDVDFDGGGYAVYNWELFFHAPLMIADRLSKNQQFKAAQKWFHYIFDPTDTTEISAPERYWRTKPLFLTSGKAYHNEKITNMLQYLASRAGKTPVGDEDKMLKRIQDGVDQWRQNPFNPYLVARTRTTAFQKMVVMKYLDNIIAWADQLFRGDNIELINEATQLYMLAADLLGPRPKIIPARGTPVIETYKTLEPKLDSFSNGLVQAEDFIPPAGDTSIIPAGEQSDASMPLMLYFCIPKNDKLLGYWDTVDDRLFKIHNCMNIEGITRQLPLFEPSIDPGLLVKARAAGLDISTAISEVNSSLPYYRFNSMCQRASDLVNEVKNFGAAILLAIEKRDAEVISNLRSENEIKLLTSSKKVKVKQHEETQKSTAALKESQTVAEVRRDYYSKLEKFSKYEKSSMEREETSRDGMESDRQKQFLASFITLIPDFKIGTPTTIGGTYGGSQVSGAASKYGDSAGKGGALIAKTAAQHSTVASYLRRWDDWKFQEKLAKAEIEQIKKQIIASQVREAVADLEIKAHEVQMTGAKSVDDAMRQRFSNNELYDWMIEQISRTYFQTYQLALDSAKQAQRCYCHELGVPKADFIQFGYWDSLRKGLLAGELLYSDIKRMEASYMEHNRREYEITKHISLAQLDPVALLQLKQDGVCFLTVPEVLFDLDYPGHYLRRIKSVSVTIPCIVGPYVGVSCTLSLLKSTVRTASTLSNGHYARQENDPRFTDTRGLAQSIVTSNAQGDSGLFEANLQDDRYLPFERSGAISDWRLELPNKFRQFDYSSISDVILHIRYTAREAGDPLKNTAVMEMNNQLNSILLAQNQKGLTRLVSLRHDYPNAWYQFLNVPPYPLPSTMPNGEPETPNAASSNSAQQLTFPLTFNTFPRLYQLQAITISSLDVMVFVNKSSIPTHNDTTLAMSLTAGSTTPTPATDVPDAQVMKLAKDIGFKASKDFPNAQPGPWTLSLWLQAGAKRIDPKALEDIYVVCHFKVQNSATGAGGRG